MKPSGHRPPSDVRRRVVRYGLWRAVATAPAMIGSLLLLLLIFGALGPWSGLLLLTWAACAAAMTTRAGERVTVRALLGFRRPSPEQAAALQPAWATALRVTETEAGEVELYVQTARMANAYAAGGRSVAVTSRVLRDYQSGRLPENLLVAVLAHELGHHATGATRPMLLLSWLTAPWRQTTRVVIGLVRALTGRQSQRGLALVVLVAGLAVAVVRAVQQGLWTAGGVLTFVALATVLCPLADAAISRHGEFAADRFAADHGLALELAAALRALDDGQPGARGWPRRLRASHPTPDRRIRALLTTTPTRAPDCAKQRVAA